MTRVARKKSLDDLVTQKNRILDAIIDELSRQSTSEERKAELKKRVANLRAIINKYGPNIMKAKAVRKVAKGYEEREKAAEDAWKDAYNRQQYGTFYDENETRTQEELDRNFEKAYGEWKRVTAEGPRFVKVSQRQYMGLNKG